MNVRRQRHAGLLLALMAFLLSMLPIAGASADTSFDPDATGSVTIHKILGVPLDQDAYPADGSELVLPADATPLAGVTFTLTRIDGVDLATEAGRDLAQSYIDNPALALDHLGEVRTSAPTDADGLATFGALPVGLYLLHESDAPAGILRSADVLITIPLTNPSTGEWIYDVHVYPKNQMIEVPTTPEPTPEPTTEPTPGHPQTPQPTPSQPTPPAPMPHTGAAGAMQILGAAVLFAGAGAIMLAARRRSEKRVR